MSPQLVLTIIGAINILMGIAIFMMVYEAFFDKK